MLSTYGSDEHIHSFDAQTTLELLFFFNSFCFVSG